MIARTIDDLSIELFDTLAEPGPSSTPAITRPNAQNPRKHPRDVRVLPKGRNFQ